MMAYRRAMWIALFGLVLAGIAYAALNWYEVIDDEEWVGMQGEALTDHYLAARRFLTEMGASVAQPRTPAELDVLPPRGTLLLGDRRLARMPAERVDRVLAWVREGGHLIVEAEQPSLDDPLLAALGLGHVGLTWVPGKGLVEKADAKAEGQSGGLPVAPEDVPADDDRTGDRRVTRTRFTSGQAPTVVIDADGSHFRVEFQPYQNVKILRPRNDALITTDKVGIRVVQFAEGRGHVSALSNFDFMTGRNLEKYDHAEFLSRLATRNGTKPTIVMAVRGGGPGLWNWLATHAWTVMLALAMLLLAWLARIVPRMGPFAPEPTPARLSLAEHLTAAGRFIGQHGGTATLMRAARERFLEIMRRERPGLARTTAAALPAALETVSGVGAARIERALFAEIDDRRGFVDAVRTLKTLEAALAGTRKAH